MHADVLACLLFGMERDNNSPKQQIYFQIKLIPFMAPMLFTTQPI